MPVLVTSVGLFRPEPSGSYSYPDHIDAASLAALPRSPGIYIFEDERARPLYVGKSVSIRARVLSHLRNPEEARMLRQARRVSFQCTAGEIGALLLESQLIKTLQPLYNKKLRRTREMCSLRLENGVPMLAYARDLDFSRTPGLYGLFATRRAALERLRMLVEEHRLCPVLCGLESPGRAGRPCFSAQLGKCAGACTGAESRESHAARLAAALEDLRVVTWPYSGAVGIVEECDGLRQMHVIDGWCYLGTRNHPFTGPLPSCAEPRFDADTYAILVRPLVLGELDIRPLPARMRSAIEKQSRSGKKRR